MKYTGQEMLNKVPQEQQSKEDFRKSQRARLKSQIN